MSIDLCVPRLTLGVVVPLSSTAHLYIVKNLSCFTVHQVLQLCMHNIMCIYMCVWVYKGEERTFHGSLMLFECFKIV